MQLLVGVWESWRDILIPCTSSLAAPLYCAASKLQFYKSHPSSMLLRQIFFRPHNSKHSHLFKCCSFSTTGTSCARTRAHIRCTQKLISSWWNFPGELHKFQISQLSPLLCPLCPQLGVTNKTVGYGNKFYISRVLG